MPTTGDLALYTPAINEQGWGDEMNDNLEEIDQAITQRSSPVGTVAMTARTTAPSGWLLCQGQAISRVTYSALFSAISTTWGIGDGVNTFNIPDLRGRSPLGAGTGSGLTARTLAANVGAESVQLVASDIAPHTHGVTDPGHTHTVAAQSGTGGSSKIKVDSSFTSANQAGAALSNTTGITIPSAGGTATGATKPSIMHPCAVINFMIKT